MKISRDNEKQRPSNGYRVDPLTDNRLQTRAHQSRRGFWKADNAPSLPSIKLCVNGLSIAGFKIKFVDLSKFLDSKFGLLLGLCSLPTAVAVENGYLFKDIASTIYKLWLSGVEDLGIVIEQLKTGSCNTTTTDIIPQELVLIENYYDHSGNTAPLYAATLSRDANGVTNQDVVNCVSNLLSVAHDEWEKGRTSWQTIAIIVGVLVALTAFISFTAVYFHRRAIQRSNPNYIPNDEESCLNKYLGNCCRS